MDTFWLFLVFVEDLIWGHPSMEQVQEATFESQLMLYGVCGLVVHIQDTSSACGGGQKGIFLK